MSELKQNARLFARARRRKYDRAVILCCALAAIAASPARADQNVIVADNGTVHCAASLKDLTRISLKDDQFASVSKVQTGNPSEDFQIVNEPSRGDIYLSVANGFVRPTLSFFGTTRKGYVYKFVCSVAGDEAQQIFIANADLEKPAPVGERWPAGLSSQEEAARLITAMYVQKPVEGFDVSWRALAPVGVGGLKVQLVGQYVGPLVTGKLLTLVNTGTSPITLSEDRVAPVDAIAVSLANASLAPGEETTAFIVLATPQGQVQP